MDNKDLLRQYVDTGLRLSQHQVESLTPNLLRTYLRKRIIAIGEFGGQPIENYELNLMSEETKVEFFKKRLITSHKDSSQRIQKWEYDEMPEETKIAHIKDILKLVITGKYNGLLMLMMGGTNAGHLEQWEYEDVGRYLGKEYQNKYIMYRFKNNASLEIWEFDELDRRKKLAYIKRIQPFSYFSEDFFNRLGEDKYFELTGKKIPEKQNRYNRDWDIPKPQEEVNQINESIKRYKDILSYGK